MEKNKMAKTEKELREAETWTFVSLVSGHERIPRKSYAEAFRDMYNYIEDALKEEGLSFQVLETALWIECNNIPERPLDWYMARDVAYELGIMKDGKLVEEVIRLDAELPQ